MSSADSSRSITGGVDTHLDNHVAAALDAHGGVLGVESFPTTVGGFVALHDWLCAFGSVGREHVHHDQFRARIERQAGQERLDRVHRRCSPFEREQHPQDRLGHRSVGGNDEQRPPDLDLDLTRQPAGTACGVVGAENDETNPRVVRGTHDLASAVSPSTT